VPADLDSDKQADASPDLRPVPPNAEDYSGCCDSGCTPCVYDLYWDAMARYEQALAAWEQRQPSNDS